MSNNKRTNRSINSRGYYIALILCAAAIGISGYLYYRHDNTHTLSRPPQQEAHIPVAATQPADVEAVATRPGPEPTLPPVGKPPVPREELKTMFPVDGQTVAVYAMDELSYNATTRDWRVHNGIDIAAQPGTAVCAAADGTVYTVYDDESMGTTVVIRHRDGYTTKYASLAKDPAVSAGDTVTMGQKIGSVGTTALLETALGDHVHFSVTCNDQPINPQKFFDLG